MSGKIYQTVEESRLNEMHRALFISDNSYIMSPSWLLFLVNWLVFESWFFQFCFLNPSSGTSLKQSTGRWNIPKKNNRIVDLLM